MISIKTGLFAAATAAVMSAAPIGPAVAAPFGVAPGALVRTESPLEKVHYRRHVARHGYYVQRPRYVVRHRHYVRRYYRPHRYGYNPGLAVAGAVLGGIAAAGAYNYYEPYYYPAYSYPAYSYGYSYPAYNYPVVRYGWGGGYWGGGGYLNSGWGW